MVKPYYDDGQITLYCGDCREILRHFDKVDVVTDPPYGIAGVWKGGGGHGWQLARAKTAERNEWDNETPTPEFFAELLRIARKAIIWGGNHFVLPPSRSWLVWNKPERGFTLAEAELAWTNLDTVVRVWDCRRSDPDREHPTQKPLSLLKWCIQKIDGNLPILDPFGGSGTTLVAAKQLGRRAIGIEISEEYCCIAVKRLAQGVLAY